MIGVRPCGGAGFRLAPDWADRQSEAFAPPDVVDAAAEIKLLHGDVIVPTIENFATGAQRLSAEGPRVRIRLPPAVSQANFN
jgi:hypothetical protein